MCKYPVHIVDIDSEEVDAHTRCLLELGPDSSGTYWYPGFDGAC